MNQTEINELKTFLVKIHTHLTDINTAWIASLDSFIKEKESELALEPKEKTTSKTTPKLKKVKPAKKE
jgi:hypothetical protein